MKHTEKIKQLRAEGKTYNEIMDILHCSKGTISYHCGNGQKEKNKLRVKKHRKVSPLSHKLYNYLYTKRRFKSQVEIKQKTRKQLTDKINDFLSRGQLMSSREFTIDDVLSKIGDKPVCYLTGQPIDVDKPSTYQFDHIIPASRGGDNSLANLGICSKKANIAKSDMTPDELIHFCKQILEYNNYSVLPK